MRNMFVSDSSCEFILETRGQPCVSFICNTWFISCLQLQINNLFQECRSSGIPSYCLNSEKLSELRKIEEYFERTGQISCGLCSGAV